MVDTTFSSGTVITSSWLNDVNDAVYNLPNIVKSATSAPYNTPIDGSSANAGLAAFFAAVSDGIGFLPGGTYTLTSLLDLSGVPLSNCVIRGVPGKTKITGAFGYASVLLGALSHVVFEDIIFETTYANSTPSLNRGVVYSGATDIAETHFRRCKFTAPNCGTQGLAIFNRTNPVGSDTCVIDGLWIEYCGFDNIGNTAVTIYNRQAGPDKYTAARRVYFRHNRGRDLGITGSPSDYGMLLSLDGYGSVFEADHNDMQNCLRIGIENTGWINGSISHNRGRDFSRIWRLVSLSDPVAPYTTRGITAIDNVCEDAASYPSLISRCDDAYLAGNRWNFTDALFGAQAAFLYLDCNGTRSFGDRFTSDSTYAVRFQSVTGTCTGNRIEDGTFDTSASAAVTATINFDGANTTDNVVDGRLSKGTGGSAWTQTTSAASNGYGYNQSGSWTPDLTFATPGDLAKTITVTGNYNRTGRNCTVTFAIDSSAFTWTTAASFLRITGLPFPALNTSQQDWGTLGTFRGITKAGYNHYALRTTQNQSYLMIVASNSATVPSNVVAADMPSAGTLALYGTITYEVQD